MILFSSFHLTTVSGIIANDSVIGEVHGPCLVRATAERELGVLDVKQGQRHLQRPGDLALSLLQELQLDSQELDAKQEPSPHVCCHWLWGRCAFEAMR